MKKNKPIVRVVAGTQERNWKLYDHAKSNTNEGTVTPFNAQWYQQIFALWQKSRYQADNNPLLESVISLLVKNVIGSDGLVLKPKHDNEKKREKVLTAWNKWTEYADSANGLDMIDLTRLALTGMLVDGEAFAAASFPNGRMEVKLFEAPMLNPNLNERYNDGTTVTFGIQRDAGGNIEGYWFGKHVTYDSYIKTGYMEVANKAELTFVPRGYVAHLFLPKRINQSRGVPYWSSTLLKAQNVLLYSDTELSAAQLAALPMAFLTQSGNSEAERLGNAPTQGQTEQTEQTDETNGTPLEDDDDPIEVEMSPGAATVLPPDMQVSPFKPEHPNTDYSAYIEKELTILASGLGLTYPELSGDLSKVNYSSGRMGSLSTAETYAKIRNEVIKRFLKPLFLLWLRNEMFTGNLGRISEKDFDMLSGSEFIGKSPRPVDPQKEAGAAKTFIEIGVKTPSQVMRELGLDPVKVYTEMVEEKKLRESLGLQTERKPVAASEEKPVDDDSDEDDENQDSEED